jgi:hypothetical protein
MAKTWSDPYPNLPKIGGVARQFGVADPADRLARTASPPPPDRADLAPGTHDLTRFRVELTLLRKEVSQLREELADLKMSLKAGHVPRDSGTNGTESVPEDGTDVPPERPLSRAAERKRRYRERLREKREEGA